MRVALLILLILVAVTVMALLQSRKLSQNKKPPTSGTSASAAEIYLGLRRQILDGDRNKFSLPEGSNPEDPWGVVMDWGVTNGTVTVMAWSDGSASLYYSSGGGHLGGAGQPTVNAAAKRTVSVAREFRSQMKHTDTFPLPRMGGVIYYLLTDQGVFTATSTEKEIVEGRDPFAKLANSAQDIITQFRLLQEQASGKS